MEDGAPSGHAESGGDDVGGKRTSGERSPDRVANRPASIAPTERRTRGRGDDGSSINQLGMDDVEAALPETLDLSGRSDLSTEGLLAIIAEAPRTTILKLDGCVSLGEDCFDCIHRALGGHITELSLRNCSQFAGGAVLPNFHAKFPSLHTLTVSGCGMERKDLAMVVVSRTLNSLPRIEIRS